MSRDRSQQRVTVQEAAERMGISESAIRKRVQRGKIPYEHDQEGRLWVWIDQAVTDSVNGPGQQKDKSRDWSHAASNDGAERYVRSLEDQVAWLRRELEGRTEEIRRRDHIIAALTENLRELRPAEHSEGEEHTNTAEDSRQPRESPESHVDVADESPIQENQSEVVTEPPSTAGDDSEGYSADERHEESSQREDGQEEGYTSTESPAEPQTATRRPWWKRIFGG